MEYRVNIALTLSHDGTFLVLYNTIWGFYGSGDSCWYCGLLECNTLQPARNVACYEDGDYVFPKNVYPSISLHGVMAHKPLVAYEFLLYMRMQQLMNACKRVILAYRAIELVHLLFLWRKHGHAPKYRTSFVRLSCTDRIFLLKYLWCSVRQNEW